ncbi:RNA-binding S4 domain-containing protein [Phragmitibacter flavus]|uniref:RNA-binding S4 domain-containing protein n=1 Tax=Phragmitibacter flavus TaxID=2576071 RepID=A0A5R8KAE5_9BACT|nr:S4 domain-containing protein [Phragmitibacter flavus]TLD69292.1 RNA-binding S4 domain-containing protein [Phragmitibacter flavus]
MRADVYLHHTRIFKTRSQATQSCQRNHVRIIGQPIKPSRTLKPGDILDVARGELNLVLRVIDFPLRRLSAPDVGTYLENLTPEANFIQAAAARREQLAQAPITKAAKPDKKQLRAIREWMEANSHNFPESPPSS